MEDYRVVLGFLLHAGLVQYKEGKLQLSLRDPHDREYAEIAKKTLVDVGLVSP